MTLLQPEGFAPIPDGALDTALATTWQALQPELALPRLRTYYDATGVYAGATFVELPPVVSDEFTAADLFALTLLSVDPPKPPATRAFLNPGPRQDELLQLLTSEHLTEDKDLAHADNDTFQAMRQLYTRVKSTLGSNPWVTASKLCARKRPALFPVRDRRIRDLLGLTRHANYEVDWQVFREIMANHDITTALRNLAEQANDDSVHLDTYPLRWLDAALWMHARATTPRQTGTRRR